MKVFANILFYALCFAVGWCASSRWRNPEMVERVRVDTVFYERPQPFAVASHFERVRLPRLLFAERVDTVTLRDTVTMMVQVERVEYADSLYRAVVSGAVVGDIRPRLETIEVYNRTVTRVERVRPRWAVTAGVGVSATPKGLQPTAGVQVGVVLWSK